MSLSASPRPAIISVLEGAAEMIRPGIDAAVCDVVCAAVCASDVTAFFWQPVVIIKADVSKTMNVVTKVRFFITPPNVFVFYL
jgi:hypothetical protein